MNKQAYEHIVGLALDKQAMDKEAALAGLGAKAINWGLNTLKLTTPKVLNIGRKGAVKNIRNARKALTAAHNNPRALAEAGVNYQKALKAYRDNRLINGAIARIPNALRLGTMGTVGYGAYQHYFGDNNNTAVGPSNPNTKASPANQGGWTYRNEPYTPAPTYKPNAQTTPQASNTQNKPWYQWW